MTYEMLRFLKFANLQNLVYNFKQCIQVGWTLTAKFLNLK